MKNDKSCRRCGKRFARAWEYKRTLMGRICYDTDLCDMRKELAALRKKEEQRTSSLDHVLND